jgi:hypothetical protein
MIVCISFLGGHQTGGCIDIILELYINILRQKDSIHIFHALTVLYSGYVRFVIFNL